jgi:hypothetical protein
VFTLTAIHFWFFNLIFFSQSSNARPQQRKAITTIVALSNALPVSYHAAARDSIPIKQQGRTARIRKTFPSQERNTRIENAYPPPSKYDTATRFLVLVLPWPITIRTVVRVVVLPGISHPIRNATFTIWVPPRLRTRCLVHEVRVEHLAALRAPFARWAGVAHSLTFVDSTSITSRFQACRTKTKTKTTGKPVRGRRRKLNGARAEMARARARRVIVISSTYAPRALPRRRD